MATKTKIERLIEDTKEIDKKENKVKIFIPKDNLNPTETSILVGINEKYAKIPLGEPIEVTEDVAAVLRSSGLIY